MRLGGVILCGGLSTRMGRSKAMLPFGGVAMLQYVTQRVQSAVKKVVVVAAVDQELPELIQECSVVRDEHCLRGPLEGLRVGLAALQSTCDAAFVTSCDAPLLVPAVINFLMEELGDWDAVVPRCQDRIQPLTAIYRTALAEIASRLLEQNESRLIKLVRTCRAKILDAELLRAVDLELNSLRNLNTPEEYEEAIRRRFN